MTLPPLPFPPDALEPYISRRTVAAHYGRHHAGYVEKTRKLVAGTPLEDAPIETIVRSSHQQRSHDLFNAAAQSWNHAFYWSSMRPQGGGEASGPLAELIEASFGSQSQFRQQFITTAANHFGSGWVWLILEEDRAKILATDNAGTPLLRDCTPLLTIDVWEHAYYLDYQHRRLDYISAFMAHLVNWTFANSNLAAALDQKGSPRWRAALRAAASEIPVRGASKGVSGSLSDR